MADQIALLDAWIKVKATVANLRAERDALKAELDALKAAPPVVTVDPTILESLTAEMNAIVGIVSPPTAPIEILVGEVPTEPVIPVESIPVGIERTAPAPQ